MSARCETPFFQNVNSYTDYSNFFGTFQTKPLASTVSGLADTALNTALTIAALASTIVLKSVSLLPVSEPTKAHIVQLSKDSSFLLHIYAQRLALAINSVIPFAGNYLISGLREQAAEIRRLKREVSRLQQSPKPEVGGAQELEAAQRDLQEAAAEIARLTQETRQLQARIVELTKPAE